MAALSIAFEAPDNNNGAGHGPGRPIDLSHLARQTMGDKALEAEVLELFAREARQGLKELCEACEETRAAVAHRMKGSARAVGAGALARASEALEARPADAAALAAVTAAVIEAENFISSLCR